MIISFREGTVSPLVKRRIVVKRAEFLKQNKPACPNYLEMSPSKLFRSVPLKAKSKKGCLCASNRLSEALRDPLRAVWLVYTLRFPTHLPVFFKPCPISAKFDLHIWPLTADLCGIRLQPFDYGGTSSTDDPELADMVFFQQPPLPFSFP